MMCTVTIAYHCPYHCVLASIMAHNINQLVSHHAVVIKPLLYLTDDQAPSEVMEGKGKIELVLTYY